MRNKKEGLERILESTRPATPEGVAFDVFIWNPQGLPPTPERVEALVAADKTLKKSKAHRILVRSIESSQSKRQKPTRVCRRDAKPHAEEVVRHIQAARSLRGFVSDYKVNTTVEEAR